MERRKFLTYMGLGWLASASPLVISAAMVRAQKPQASERETKGLQSALFYVSPAGNDAWSGKLADPNQTRTDGPFATLQRARDAIRVLKGQQGGTLKQPVTVVLRGGTYFLSEPLVLTSEDSGTADFPISYTAYENETPVISGGRQISGWQQQGNIWKVTLPEVKNGSWDFLALRVGDDWAIRARYPNFEPDNPHTGGWLFSKNTSPSKTEVVVESGKFPAWSDWSGAEIYVYTAKGWGNAIIPINRADRDKRTLFIKSSENIDPGDRFFITNVRQALDSPQEWFLDKKSGELLYFPPQDKDLNNLEVVAPKLPLLIDIKGNIDTGNFAEYIYFKRITFTDTDSPGRGSGWRLHAAIWLTAARQCVIEKCNFHHLAGYAILMKDGCAENQILRNKMVKLGQGGVLLGTSNAVKPQETPHSSNNRIMQNEITDCGLIYKTVGGIAVLKGSNNQIAYNRISRLPRWGISIGGNSKNNLVEYNEVVDTNLETSDTGAIYADGQSRETTGNIIRFNSIRNSRGLTTTPDGRILSPNYSWGIYLDNYTSNTTVYGNIVVNTVRGAICIIAGKDNVVENNIFVNGLEHQITLLPIGEFMRGNIFRRNIIVFENPKASVWYSYPQIWWRRSVSLMKECNFNLYWHTGGLDLAKTQGAITQEANLAKWQSLGFDRNSLIGEPLFVDAKNGDFRLRPDSPAFRLGFKPIPVERIGAGIVGRS